MKVNFKSKKRRKELSRIIEKRDVRKSDKEAERKT